jgi:Fic family protein
MPPVVYHEGRFPPAAIDWQRLIPLVGPAFAPVARYDGMLAAIPNPQILLSPLSTQEAVLSSRIEGTQATMGDVLEFEAGEEKATGERREDIREVLNYRRAMSTAAHLLNSLPLSQRVITPFLSLYEDLKRRIPELTRSQYAIRALDWVFARPMFRSSDFVAAAGIPAPTARRILRVLSSEGILKRIIAKSGRRSAFFSLPKLLNIAEGVEIF